MNVKKNKILREKTKNYEYNFIFFNYLKSLEKIRFKTLYQKLMARFENLSWWIALDEKNGKLFIYFMLRS